MILQPSVNKDIPYFNTRMDKNRSKNYRRLRAGIRYHQNELLSHIQIGFRRGYTVDVRLVIQKLMTWAKRIFGKNVQFFRAEVWENADVTAQWRVHVHMIWNAPYIKQRLLVEKIEKYAGDSVNVYIRLVNDHRKAANYLMQYIVDKQEGKVYFTQSRGWLPEGYEGVWKDIKREFYQYVPRGINHPMDDPERVQLLMIQSSPEWKKAGLIENMNAWIDEQRDKSPKIVQSQMDANGELFYPRCKNAK